MIDWAAAHFGTGLDAASALRAVLLESLGAEQEWLSWDNDQDAVSWITGPLATAFSVRPASSLTPGLGVLHVSTRCAWVDDPVVAEEMVDGLNLNTTVNRWTIHDQPHPAQWEGPEGSSDAVDARRLALLPRPDEGSSAAVHLELSVVTGDGLLELPLAAVVAGVREQIAKATAVATLEETAAIWTPAAVTMAGRAREGDMWHEVVYHYDNVVTPASGADARPLLAALVTAFTRVQAELEQAGSAVWVGTGDDVGLTCEVPYGEGPFPLGLVGSGIAPHLKGPHTSTSLVQSSVVDHPQLGRGLMFTLRLGADPAYDEPALAAALLNQQHCAGRAAEAVAHGWGAWIFNQNLMHALFLPAAWATQLDQSDLEQLMRCLLDDVARLSPLSRVVLEPLCDVDEDDLFAGNLPVTGLAAGPRARGPEFGEPGAGADLAARMLSYLWRDLVAGDTQWSSLEVTEGVGFDYWPNRYRQRFRAAACGDGGGALVTIETLLPAMPPPDVLLARPLPGAIMRSADGLVVRSVLHVHDDSLNWIGAWGAPLAVAQALLADQLENVDGTSGNALVPHPELGARTDPDQMLELFDPGTPWRETAANPLDPAVLALAGSVAEPVPHGGRVAGDGVVELDWLQPIDSDDLSWTARSTTVSRHQDDSLGTCLLLRTALAAEADAVELCEAANDWLVNRANTTVVGGFSPTPDGVMLTSLVPIPLDRSTGQNRHIGFVGTCLGHHIDGLTSTINAVGGVASDPCDVATLSDGLVGLPRFYRECRLLSEEADLHVETSTDGGAALVTLGRPASGAAVATGWPLVGAVMQDGEESVLQTRVTVPVTGDVALGLRLVHSALVQPAGASGPDTADLARRTSGAAAEYELEAALSSLVELGRLSVSEDGDLEVVTGEEGSLIRLQYDGNAPHPIWGPTPTVRGIVVGGDIPAVSEPGIGAWTTTDDGAAYTVSLPPFALACPRPARRVDMLTYALLRVIGMCEAAATP